MGRLLQVSLVCLSALLALTIAREHYVLRTYLTVVPGILGLWLYVKSKYRSGAELAFDSLTTICVIAQFLIPSLYLVTADLRGMTAVLMNDYLDLLPDAAVLAILSQSAFFVGYELNARKSLSRSSHALEARAPLLKIEPLGYFKLIFPFICVVWISRFLLVRTGSYYHLSHTDFMFDSPMYSSLAQINKYGLYLLAGWW